MNYFSERKIPIGEILEENHRKKVLIILNECLNKVEFLLDDSIENIKLINNFGLRKETFVIFNIAKKLTNLLKINDPIKKKVKLSHIDLIFCFFKGIIEIN